MNISGIVILLFYSVLPAWILSQDNSEITSSPLNMVNNWELSATFDISGLPKDTYPHFFTIFNARWEPVDPDSAGWISIIRKRGQADILAYGAFGRSFFYCNETSQYKIRVEYYEEISIFLDGKFIQHAENSLEYPAMPFDFEFTAIRGLHELFIFVISKSENWKFRIVPYPAFDPCPTDHTITEIIWETEKELLTPESVLYDPENEIYYVTSYDYMYYTKGSPSGYISRISKDGKILDHEWIKGLFAPTGMCLYKNKLYVTVRNGVIVFDTKKGDYITRYDIPGTEFLNDITVDSKGRIYISDTSRDPAIPDIYILEKDQVQPWLTSEDVERTNGIYVNHDHLLIGNNGSGLLQAVDLEDKSITTICSLGAGIIDGIRTDSKGNYLISHWEGKIFRISLQGRITEIFDTRLNGYNAADFEFLKENNMLVVPTFLGNNVIALKLME